MPISLDTVKQFAPVVYFHDNEQYFPCSIEFLLQNATLKDRNDPSWKLANPTPASLQQYAASNYYVAINPSQYNGMGTSAPMYYAVQEYDDAIQITYVMLYAYQGPQTCRALRAGTEFNCIVSNFGIHQGDLESVVVMLVPQGGGQYRVLRVGYDAHGDLEYFTTQRVAWEGTHPVVNVALNGHSSRNMLHDGDRITEFSQPGSVAIISALSQSGQVWRPSEFKLLGLDSTHKPIGDQVWAAFQGRLGDMQDNTLESATYFDGSNLSSLDWSFVKLTDWAARLFDQYPEDLKHGDGPRGPGERPWVNPASGTLLGDGLMVLQAIDDIGEGPGAVAWLPGDFATLAGDEILQAWANGSSLGMILYGSKDGSAITPVWRTDDIGEGPGAVAWLKGNYVGDERKELVQAWSNGSSLGMVLYGTDGQNAMARLWRNDDMGEGPGAVAWLVGDFNGDGKDEIVQGWANGSSLGIILYGSDGTGGLNRLWKSDDMGEGPGATAWLVGDFNGDGKDEIVQGWANGSSLGIILYGSDGAGGLKQLWKNDDMGEGPGATAWLVGRFAVDGSAQIAQAWANGSSLAFIVYGSDGAGGLKTLWKTDDIGEGPGAVAWLVGNFIGDGKDEILQAWKNGSSLGLIVYGTV